MPLSSTIVDALRGTRNIDALYTHQASAINALGRSQHVVVSTRTASGKSVIYQVCRNVCPYRYVRVNCIIRCLFFVS